MTSKALQVVKTVYSATWGKYVFAGMYDRFLKKFEAAGLSQKRAEFIAPAYGRTLELGAGTGLNLPHYPDAVTEMVISEPYPHMVVKLAEKVEELDLTQTVQLTVSPAEKIPFPDNSFDTVVAAMILCTVKDPEPVLAEIERVLKPGGQYLFLEHVRNPDPKIARKQDFIQPGWFLFGNECHCNRPTVETLQASGLKIEELKHDKIPGAAAWIEAMVTGVAKAVKTGHSSSSNGATAHTDKSVKAL
ncbi:class I SAM-dependent methyltransferase [Streptomyces sp. NBC_01511]|uniref:class I SAM-dependent methyltransferase n=1 Tax=unclassified Streptomyces TaxID=2593676 RepID=UPI00386DAB94